MDWVSRAVLAWRLSNTLGAEFCVEALEKALSRYGRPEIFTRDPLLRRSQGARVKGAHLECAPGTTTYSPSL